MNDLITKPAHYTQGIECWDYILSHKMGYLEGNVIKYITRYKYKDGLNDLFKAKAYITRLIQLVQEETPLVEQPLCGCDGSLPHYPCLNDKKAWPEAEAACLLDGRNCPADCSCQGLDEEDCACGHPERGICSAPGPITEALNDVARLNGAVPLWPSKAECAKPFDIDGGLTMEEEYQVLKGDIDALVQKEEGSILTMLEELISLPILDHDEYNLGTDVRSGSREDNTIGDYRRGGPASTWMKRPCRYDPNE